MNYKKLVDLTEALKQDKCGEVVHRKWLEMYASFGMKHRFAFLDFGKFYCGMEN